MKKIIDRQGRLFGVISIIDILVIIVVALLATGIYIRYFSLSKTAIGQESAPITYKMIIDDVRDYTVNSLRVGDTLYNKTASEAIGTITDISVKEAAVWSGTVDGTQKKGIIEGKYDVTLTVEASGVVSEGRYYVSRTTELGANQKNEYVTKYCSITGTVIEIDQRDIK